MTTLFRIESDRLCLRCEQAGLDESRPLTAADQSRFRGWLQDYRNPLREHGDETARLRLGRELYAWLDGDAGWLARLRAAVEPPWIVEFRAPRDPGASVRLFLQLPWELLADDRGYLAADLALRYAPVRRLGEPTQPAEPSPCRLSLVACVHGRRAPRPAPLGLRGRGSRHSGRHGEDRPGFDRGGKRCAGVAGGARGGGSAGGCSASVLSRPGRR